MFHSSTQREFWIFKDVNEIKSIREKANFDYINSRNEQNDYLTPAEEKDLVLHYEYQIKKFCGDFHPPVTMPSVVGTSVIYFKRFYLRNSVMNYHPRDIYLICVYLAMKIEEFNVSIDQFIKNIHHKSDVFSNIIINLELLLIEKLDFHLTIHNVYRPFEGFLLDIKARCPDIKNSDMLRQSALEFLDKILNTDAMLLYPPSQIALTALVYSSSKNKIDYIDKYCQDVLLKDLNKDEVKQMLTIIKSVNRLSRDIAVLNMENIERIEKKLIKCYNIENDPRSQVFQDRMRRYLEEEDNESFI